ncbi:MAG: DUF2157 domain-containing protein [Hyphomicrobiales bacterium]
MSRYLSALKNDMPRWIEQGWISGSGAETILQDVASRKSKFSFANVLAILGALLLCFGVMTFVAANWAEISKLWRLIILLLALWTSYGAAIYFKAHQLPGFAEASLLTGIGVFGASIMLISQTYHIDGHAPDAVWLWALGALATALACRSRASIGAFFVLITVWSGWEIVGRFEIDAPILHWQFLPWWIVGTVYVACERWRPGYHLAAISFFSWLYMAIAVVMQLTDINEATGALIAFEVGLLIAALGCFVASLSQASLSELRAFSKPLTAYGFAALLFNAIVFQFLPLFGSSSLKGFQAIPVLLPAIVAAGLFVLANLRGHLAKIDMLAGSLAAFTPVIITFITAGPGSALVFKFLMAGFIIALAIWAIRFGWREHIRVITILGYIAFGVELLYIYFETFGTLLNTAIFYLIAGALLLALALGFTRLEQKSATIQEDKL